MKDIKVGLLIELCSFLLLSLLIFSCVNIKEERKRQVDVPTMTQEDTEMQIDNNILISDMKLLGESALNQSSAKVGHDTILMIGTMPFLRHIDCKENRVERISFVYSSKTPSVDEQDLNVNQKRTVRIGYPTKIQSDLTTTIRFVEMCFGKPDSCKYQESNPYKALWKLRNSQIEVFCIDSDYLKNDSISYAIIVQLLCN
jgi:hypothetical protein